MAVLVLADVVDVGRPVVVGAPGHGVYYEARYDAHRGLDAEYLQHEHRRSPLGYEYGQHLVGGGQEHGQERAPGYYAAGVEV